LNHNDFLSNPFPQFARHLFHPPLPLFFSPPRPRNFIWFSNPPHGEILFAFWYNLQQQGPCLPLSFPVFSSVGSLWPSNTGLRPIFLPPPSFLIGCPVVPFFVFPPEFHRGSYECFFFVKLTQLFFLPAVFSGAAPFLSPFLAFPFPFHRAFSVFPLPPPPRNPDTSVSRLPSHFGLFPYRRPAPGLENTGPFSSLFFPSPSVFFFFFLIFVFVPRPAGFRPSMFILLP